MPDNPRVRPLRLPPAAFDELTVSHARLPARTWFRVHQSTQRAVYFSRNAAHRFTHPDGDLVLYLGCDVETCLFERFGDTAYDGGNAIALSLWNAHSVSQMRLPALRVCDLTKARTLSALGTDLGTLMHNDVAIPQAWGRALQRHPAALEAIKFSSRFNNKPCLAVFHRGGIEARLHEKLLGSLSDTDAAVEWLDRHRVSLY